MGSKYWPKKILVCQDGILAKGDNHESIKFTVKIAKIDSKYFLFINIQFFFVWSLLSPFSSHLN